MNHPFKVGQKVWSLRYGHGTIYEYRTDCDYPILAQFPGGFTEQFTEDGKELFEDLRPTLFHREIPIFGWPNPGPLPELPNLAVDTKVVVWMGSETKHHRHFKRWDGQNCVAFTDGESSWTSTGEETHWDHWELPQ